MGKFFFLGPPFRNPVLRLIFFVLCSHKATHLEDPQRASFFWGASFQKPCGKINFLCAVLAQGHSSRGPPNNIEIFAYIKI